MKKNAAQLAEAEHLLQVYGQWGFEPVSAKGVHIQCKDRELLDLYGGHAVAGIGYSHPRLIKALKQQADTLFFQSNAVALGIRAEAGQKLASFAPGDLNQVFLVNSGAEANENALRIALKYTGRKKVVAIEHGFHGRTAAAGACTWGAEKWYAFPSKPFEVEFLPRDEVSAVNSIVDEQTAAVILEPVQGVAGAYDLNKEFVQAIAARCKEVGAVLIADEVQSGIGRCGAAFAIELFGVTPDIITSAKSLGGGFPCGAIIVSDALAEVAQNGDLGTTFGGGPLASAMIATVIDVINDEQLLQNVQQQSEFLRANLPIGPVIGVQGKGFLTGLICNRPAKEVSAALLEKNILVGSSSDPKVIRLLPPLTIQQEHIQQLLDALAEMT
ncbi:MAG: aminotransferase class III-fold pyridoxal phosphate-dependent enzyme [Gammaproteobacteria bacterium]|nr:aminotransferase class III-fold pyridoxal phosphate-dependent enzyme [Gammaproteobacteria bacterium]